MEIGLTSVHIGFSPPGTGRLLPPLLLLSLSSSAGGLPTERERERERPRSLREIWRPIRDRRVARFIGGVASNRYILSPDVSE